MTTKLLKMLKKVTILRSSIKLLLALVLICLLCLPVMAALPDGNRMEQLGERAAYTAMDQLQFAKGDPDVMVLTNAGRAVVDGQTTERTLSGITKISGLQNGDNTLWTVNRAEWKPLWFYFYDKDTGKGLYLVPDSSFYTMSDAEAGTVPYYSTFSTNKLVTGDIYQMLSDTHAGNETEKALGGEAFSIISITNAWAHGAPYDLLSAVMLHNHFCPGVSSGYLLARYVEEKMPLTNGTSYVVISSPSWCKDDVFPILWDTTPAKGGQYQYALSDQDQETLTTKYGVRPAGIYIRWDGKAKTGHALLLGFQFDSSTWTGPSWGEKPVRTVEMVENIKSPEKYVSVIREFDVNQTLLKDLENPANNPYKVIGDL